MIASVGVKGSNFMAGRVIIRSVTVSDDVVYHILTCRVG